MSSPVQTAPPRAPRKKSNGIRSSVVKSILKAIDDRLAGMDERLRHIEALLTSTSTVSADEPGVVSDAAWAAHVAPQRAAAQLPPAPPQLFDGVDTLRLPDNTELGRMYTEVAGSTTERWLLADPAMAREQASVFVDKLDPNLDPAKKSNTHDLGTGYTATTAPNAGQAIDTFGYTAIPNVGSGAPPSGVVVRFYALKTITLSGPPPTVTESGRLYREVYVNSNGDEVWSDHWVLWPAFDAPKVADPITGTPAVRMQVDRLTTGVPASADAFFATERAREAANPGNYRYAYVAFTWLDFP